ncbi:hypothetical protein COO60DRAFT_409053 [Scenedesmus sp. NREL 46B-D3]|nr:hypothetical protein COO60DRAFT_409053 [Scenedesmus sp. NREL 46B-D3]
MGVFLLRAYCEAKDLYKNIQIPVNNTGKPRIVVFDAPGALRTFLRPQRRGLLYDFHQQQMRVRSMVRAFKQAGYELVVFLDNAIPDEKLTTWYRRRAVEAATLGKLNKHLAGEVPASKPDKDKNLPEGLWLPPNTALQVLGDEFAQLGCKVFFSFDDSDREAAYWAKENKAFAVITDDTDFMCYEGVDRIWSANIKLPTGRSQAHPQAIRVSELRRQSLLGALGLSQTQLQQLAGLLGNDHIKHIAKDRVAALKAANPNEHVVALLAKQVLELQPQLASLSPAAAAAAAATAAAVAAAKEAAAALERERATFDAAVLQVVATAVANVCRKAAEDAAAAAAAKGKKGKGAAGGAAAEVVAPEMKQLVASAVSRTVAAANGAEAGSEDEQHDELDDGHHEDDEHGQEEDAAAAAADSDAAVLAADASSAAGEAAAGSPSDMLVDRCRRSLLQYGPCEVQPPVQVGSGDRWLLQHKGILMRGVGLEDMSKTPSHVLLQPLRLSVYASMGLSSVTEYLCVPDEKWKEWAAGRAVSVPAQPAAGGKKLGKPRRSKDKGGAINPAVKKLVAAVFASVVAANGGTPVAAADAAAEGCCSRCGRRPPSCQEAGCCCCRQRRGWQGARQGR